MKNERDRMDHLEVEMLSLRWAVEDTGMSSKILEEIYQYIYYSNINNKQAKLNSPNSRSAVYEDIPSEELMRRALCEKRAA